MKTRILCFGDSNTWGYRPEGGRYDETVRWPMRMQHLLGDAYAVVEEGFNGRTTVMDDPCEGGYKSGAAYLPPCLMTHNPLDLVILMLGTNDTKCRFSMTSRNIAQGMEQLVNVARVYGENSEGKTPRLLIVSPVPNGEGLMKTPMGSIFGEESVAVSRELAEEYRRLALLQKVEFLDAGAFAQASPLDAIHLSREGQWAIADAMRQKALDIFAKKEG